MPNPFFDNFSSLGGEENVTAYECQQELVKVGELTFDGILCLRAYKDLPDLYDVTWNGISLADSHYGITTSLGWQGISPQNAHRFLARYLESFSWNKKQ